MEPIFFDALDAEARKRALDAYKRAVYPELFEDYAPEALVEQVGPFTDDDSIIKEIRALGIIFSAGGDLVTDGDSLYISYQGDGLVFVHVGVGDIRNFKPHYLRYVARRLDRSIQ